jgi:hypothetical protein
MDVKKNNWYSVNFQNPTQILNMGGPWIGDFFIDEIFISNNVLIDNIVFQPEWDKIFFTNFEKHLFFVNYINLKDFFVYKYIESFDIVNFGSQIDENSFSIYHAFHNKNNDFIEVIHFTQNDFIKLKRII